MYRKLRTQETLPKVSSITVRVKHFAFPTGFSPFYHFFESISFIDFWFLPVFTNFLVSPFFLPIFDFLLPILTGFFLSILWLLPNFTDFWFLQIFLKVFWFLPIFLKVFWFYQFFYNFWFLPIFFIDFWFLQICFTDFWFLPIFFTVLDFFNFFTVLDFYQFFLSIFDFCQFFSSFWFLPIFFTDFLFLPIFFTVLDFFQFFYSFGFYQFFYNFWFLPIFFNDILFFWVFFSSPLIGRLWLRPLYVIQKLLVEFRCRRAWRDSCSSCPVDCTSENFLFFSSSLILKNQIFTFGKRILFCSEFCAAQVC